MSKAEERRQAMRETNEKLEKSAKTNERLRALTWEDYDISRGRYKELQGFCLQYREKKTKAGDLEAYALAVANGGGGGGSSKISRPTESAAIRHYQESRQAIRDCRIIEEAAMWAASAGGYKQAWRSILRNVTDGTGYDILRGIYVLPFSVADFYGVRRAFFHRLDQLQRLGAEADPAI
jgi:hypothetical protein